MTHRLDHMTAALASIVLWLAGCFDSDRPPPCSEDDGVLDGPSGPVHGPADPGPGFPGPPPDGSNYDQEPRYRLNAAGEVCACGPYELGCVDSQEKAKASGKVGTYCPYPREGGDPVITGGGIGIYRDPAKPYCRCWWTMYDICNQQHAESIEIYGDSAGACEDKLFELLGGQNAMLRETHPDIKGHDLDSIQCVSR